MKYPILLISAMFLLLLACQKENTTTKLEANFKNPPASTKPKTWMHAMSGNMTAEGLSKDLESMAEVGLGGVLLFNIAQGIPNGPIIYNSEKHHRLIQHAAQECERLGLSFGVHNCDGWSSSGGPWITPEQSMKMVVWSETIVEGGRDIKIKLEQPTTREKYYEEIAVIAYPALHSEVEDANNKPIITSSDKNFIIALASDFKLNSVSLIEKKADKNPWIQYDYGRPYTIQSAYVVCNDRNGNIMLQTSDDGKLFTDVTLLHKERTGKGEWVHTGQFDPVTAPYFRLHLEQTMTLKEARLSATYSMQNVFGRIAMARTEDSELLPIGEPHESMIVDKESIINVSSDMNSDGVLTTNLPPGDWTIMRFGYTSTGAFNHPASDAGRGLECDKLNREAFKTHYEAFISRVVKEAGSLAPNALQYVEIDSYEMGGQNWTSDFGSIFKNAKGYDLIAFLPLFAGRFVESAESSEAICWDIRDVLCDLMTENYFGYFSELCKRDGIKSYIEPYGFGPVNDLDVGGKADINMGEFWMNRAMTMVKSAVSGSHIYGKNVISAESFTSRPELNWKGHPALAKISGDKAWAMGINEFMFHRFAHQANTHVKPGMTMNRWGFHFDRTQTWWESAGADWFRYIARGSYLLRQGVPVSDLLVFVGDGAPNSAYERDEFEQPIPMGTNFDCVNADVLINRISLKDGKMILPEGTEYQVLVLKNCETLSLESLQRIHEISSAGVPVVGTKPVKPSGYMVSQEVLARFNNMAEEIWTAPKTYTHFNWGVILKEEKISADFNITGRKDIDFMHRHIDGTDIYFIYNPDSIAQQLECTFRIQNKIPELWNPMDGKIKKTAQFVNMDDITKTWINLQAEESVFVVFRETSKGVVSVIKPSIPEQYHLSKENKLVLQSDQNGLIEAELNNGKKLKIEIKDVMAPMVVTGPWEVEFLKEHDYEGKHIFETLNDWRDHQDENIKYYSGTAIYRNSFDFAESAIHDENRFILDLGKLHIVAEVFLNGKNFGVSWIQPFELDITDALQAGRNLLEIHVTNQWSNKLIGDERFPPSYEGYKLEGNFPKGIMMDWYTNNEPMPAGQRTTFCTGGFYTVNDELLPSGLMGPVQLEMIKMARINN